ncbi:hypothetical protein LTR99_007255 [Exophiala xenobiotica]|uniref:Uncharacterized protein n=1 Tax=Vermiconidia calcicola TaxID=1690605 RepID=A0AAV9PVS4_9PEZI|nr:hypothetical protein LTR47_010289 [Exophiala xenobiotica]KAK5528013.1 hypothetical protein LTR25_010679 [Vermiconidia calcicola]KAK5529298.1 hypothetical protein LTR23_010774 [Chaetothyriales sp. CCFEE 6169]KAK5245630.1 hypothetical protein LTS06_008995 [Exophiala xenobiotica]KAK5266645.1 hypothetical protein LTR96_007895 [Exophiala xenobiotica]
MTQPPFSLRFLFRISALEHANDPQHAGRFIHNGYWLPSERRQDFTKTSTTNWWVWDPGATGNPQHGLLRRATASEVPDARQTKAYSMFWDPERSGYVLVPFDCSALNVAQATHDWRRLSFGRVQRPGAEPIAIAGYFMESYTLPVAGPPAWFEQLLPRVCQPPGGAAPGRPCALAGDLAILIGLLAFSTKPEHVLNAVAHSFRPNRQSTTFRQHQLATPDRTRRRGMVIEIWTANPDHLRAWETGAYGAIFT